MTMSESELIVSEVNHGLAEISENQDNEYIVSSFKYSTGCVNCI